MLITCISSYRNFAMSNRRRPAFVLLSVPVRVRNPTTFRTLANVISNSSTTGTLLHFVGYAIENLINKKSVRPHAESV